MKYLLHSTIFICDYTHEEIKISTFYLLFHIYCFSSVLIFSFLPFVLSPVKPHICLSQRDNRSFTNSLITSQKRKNPTRFNRKSRKKNRRKTEYEGIIHESWRQRRRDDVTR